MSKKIPFETTLEVRDACLCLHIQRAARALARRFDDALRPLGLTNGQFSLLMAVNRPEPPAIGPVAQLLAMDRTTLTAALKPLERSGLITVSTDANDRRSRLLTLTNKGHQLLASALPVWRHAHATVEASLIALHPDDLRINLQALSGRQESPQLNAEPVPTTSPAVQLDSTSVAL
ncbi:MarR family transcriptional regulator [Pollutimonas bauzanensis]|uniref:MarR family winged helix-turn-helix transcriptional regulator n=1 Tax=Pollutimonas bauzanensis TaxID=658167 RepID=UPI0033421A37